MTMRIGTPVKIGTTNTSISAVSSNTITTTAAIPAGSLAVVGICINIGVTASSVSDGTNTYTKAETTGLVSSSNESSIWYCLNVAAVANGATITVNYSGSGTGQVSLFAAYVSGIVTTSGLDQIAQNTATTSSSVTATTPSLSQSQEICFGAGQDVATSTYTYSGASGFTNLYTGGPGSATINNTAFDYSTTNATTAISYAPTWSSALGLRQAAVVATFIVALRPHTSIISPNTRRQRSLSPRKLSRL
jgi:hypothetical protein